VEFGGEFGELNKGITRKKTLMLTPQRLRERLPCKISLSRRSLQWRKISVLTARRRGIIRKIVPIS
jgi:hypothetical protein